MRVQIEQSGLLDPKWYLERYPDVRELGIAPVEHYLRIGARLLRDPGPGFSTGQYLAANPDVERAGVNPLWHYIAYGRKEGRKLAPSGAAAPVAHAERRQEQRTGAATLATGGSNVGDARYLAMRHDVAASGLWDENWYLARYYFQFVDFKARLGHTEYVTPLDHYLREGWRLGLEPSARLPLQVSQAELAENKITYFLNTFRFKGYHLASNPWVLSPARATAYLAQKQTRTAANVVYTCVTGGYDNLMQPYHVTDEWDYVCFTDDPELLAKGREGVWEVRALTAADYGAGQANRWHKMHPHLLFPKYRESIYLDGNISIISSYLADEIQARNVPFLLPRHFARDCVYKEIEALLASPRFSAEDKARFSACREFLESEGLPAGLGLTENNVVYRRHHDPLVVNLMADWWDAYLRISPRDQTTLAYVLWKNGVDASRHLIANCRVNYRDFCIVKHNRVSSLAERRIAAKALEPAFADRNICVVFSTNEYFVPYLGVAISSLLKNSSAHYNYDIIILGRALSPVAQEKLAALGSYGANVSVRLYDMGEIYESLPKDIFHVEGYVPVETYNKCFITKILSGYKRCVYLDSDIVVVDDVQKLHDAPLDGKAIAASVNVANVNAAYCRKEIKGRRFDEYLRNVLGVNKVEEYFQAGVLVLDLEALEKMDLPERALDSIGRVRQPIFFDQCIFNRIFYGNVKFISTAWNHVWYMQSYSYLRGSVPDWVFFDYAKGRVRPKIIHFASKDKPNTRYGWQLGDVFWKYTYESPFKDEILGLLAEADNDVSRAMRSVGGERWYSTAPRLLVHVHLFYVDQLDVMLRTVANISDCEYDLFVTMVEANAEVESRIVAEVPGAKVLLVPNVGYDIYPFLHVLQQVRLSDYQFVLKIHSKNRREPGQDVVYGISVPAYAWRDELIEAVAGSKEIFRRNLEFLREDSGVGCLGARRFVFSTRENREEITYRLPEWREKCGVADGHHYIGGSMFLARAYPFERLKGLRMRPDDFRSGEMGTKDYKNTAHIFERLLGIVVESEGFRVVGV
ncbi:glycosyltransferase [Luteimonas sp. SDU82]|uniref:glycosyltransferase n=1 Tax=Luteimonas sp. SDU82 TaxID=3422592 RepID=UPI003EB849D0